MGQEREKERERERDAEDAGRQEESSRRQHFAALSARAVSPSSCYCMASHLIESGDLPVQKRVAEGVQEEPDHCIEVHHFL
jgi:hypothetical protein